MQPMQMTPDQFMPILFKVLFGFIIINMVVNLILLYTRKLRIYKLLATFWPSLLLTFFMHSLFQTGNLAVALEYSTSLLPLTIFAMIGFEAIGRPFPLKKYIFYYLSVYPLTFLLNYLGYGFTVVAMPFAIATASPLAHAFIRIHFLDRKKTTKLQKVLGIIYLLLGIHCINFALFRMVPGAQLWGWFTAYALYDCMAIVLPSIALEEDSLSEQIRLQSLVDIRTAELMASHNDNENLLKVLLHDISGPLMVTKFYASTFKGKTPADEILLERMKISQAAMESIILQVKSIYGLKNLNTKIFLQPVVLDECFSDVSYLFTQKLEKKNISLIFRNQLSPDTKVMADKTTLTHSVLSNLVSNGLNFAEPDTEIIVTAKEDSQGSVILEVQDGVQGTSDLSVVKSFVDVYGGQIELTSKHRHARAGDHSSNVRITLNRAD